MQRQIKFKAWDKLNKRVREVTNICFDLGVVILTIAKEKDSEWIYQDEFNLDDIKFMQYTGLKDKNGVEVYCGDIIKRCVAVHQGGIKEYSIGEVYFEPPCFVIKNYSKTKYANKCVPLKIPLDNTILKDEVIGNIYENPELISGD